MKHFKKTVCFMTVLSILFGCLNTVWATTIDNETPHEEPTVTETEPAIGMPQYMLENE